MPTIKKNTKNVTLKISLRKELGEGLTLSNRGIKNTANEAKTFWVGYNQAIQDIKNRFFKNK